MLAEICSENHEILQGNLHPLVHDISIDIPWPENKESYSPLLIQNGIKVPEYLLMDLLSQPT